MGDFSDGWSMEDKNTKERMLAELDGRMQRLLKMVTREKAAISRTKPLNPLEFAAQMIAQARSMAVSGILDMQYDPAGQLRPGGRRHDNDMENIREILIPPTQAEIMCTTAPFLPGNITKAPHHLEADSMERLLDIQFRLLREELLYAFLSLAVAS